MMGTKESNKKYRESPKGRRSRKKHNANVRLRYATDTAYADSVRHRCKIRMRKKMADPAWRKHVNALARKASKKRLRKPGVREQRDQYAKERKLNNWLQTQGWTVEQYEEMLAAGCALCGSKTQPVKDHDHSTGKARGILCNSCNRCLGWFEKRVDNILEYVKRGK